MIILLFLRLLISIILYLLSFFVSFKVKNFNKLRPFECGFRTVGFIHTSFSVHFFIILIIFVIFDLEVVLLIGCVVLRRVGVIPFLFMMCFVVGGIYLE
jgi:NADH:ubiquinone oxidoreductase subunit 3 (subunit A)